MGRWYGTTWLWWAEQQALWTPALALAIGVAAFADASLWAIGFAAVLASASVAAYLNRRGIQALRLQLSELAQSEGLYRKLVEEQEELVMLSDRNLKVIYGNAAFRQHFNVQEHEVLGRSIYELVSEAELPHVKAAFQNMVLTGQPMRGLSRVPLLDGREKWIAWTNLVQQHPNGELVLHSVGRDVTKRKQAERALRASEDFLARTGRVAGVGGWEVDLATEIVRWSAQVRGIFEVEGSLEPVLSSVFSFISAPEELKTAFRTARELGQSIDLELQAVTAKRRRIWLRVVGEIEQGGDGVASRLVGAFQDITTRKELEQQLGARERFIRNITDNLPVRIAYIDRDLTYRFVNSAQLQRLNTSGENPLGRRRSDIIDVLLPSPLMTKVCAALEGEVQRFEFKEDVNGSPCYIQSQLIPDLRDDGCVSGLYYIGIDITPLKTTELRLRELSDIVEHSPDFIVQTDGKGVITYANPAARMAVRSDRTASLEGRHIAEFCTAESSQRLAEDVIPNVSINGVWIGDTNVRTSRGQVIPVNKMVIAHRDPRGIVVRYSAVMRDISQAIANRNALKEQTATLEAVVEAIPAIVTVFDEQLRFRLVNHAFERWRGRGRGEVIGRRLADLFGAQEHERSFPWARRALAGETVSYETDYPDAAHHRHLSNSCVPLRLDDGSVVGVVAVAQDITLHREEERRLHNLAARDALTGILNRTGFDNYLENRSGTDRASIALLYIDLDRFKPVNDTYGHSVGDELLRQFAQRLQELVRPTDVVARLGGDEFAVLINDIRTKEAADMVAEKIVHAAQQPFLIETASIAIGASVGVAFGIDADGLKGLVNRADAAVYRAKAAGRGRKA